ncbi:MAG: ATP-binding protein [Bacteroidota bacterium]
MSLRFRITLLFVVIVAILLAIFSIYVYYVTVSIRTNAFYDRLWERVDITTQILNESGSIDLDSIQPSLRNKYWTTLPEEEIIIFKSDKNFFYINEYFPVQFDYSRIRKSIDQGQEVEMQIGVRQFVGYTKMIGNQYSDIIVSAFDKNGRRLLNNLKITIITAYLASILLIILLGLYFSRETFSPIAKIINAAEQISGSGLHLRVPTPKGKGELVKLANTINESLTRIETAFQMQKSFVSHASHELRTPVTAFTGGLELALMKERSPDEYRAVISSALEDGRRLSHLIDQLLLFAQTTGAQEVHARQKLRMDELLLDLLEKMSKKPYHREIEFLLDETEMDEQNLVIEGNDQLLTIAVGNVLDNALKYSPKGSQVSVKLIPGTLYITVCIQDYGQGISSGDMEHIFEPFYRSEKALTVQGFGIGLSLARRIIEMHHGILEIQSEMKKGTTVCIRLPILQESLL